MKNFLMLSYFNNLGDVSVADEAGGLRIFRAVETHAGYPFIFRKDGVKGTAPANPKGHRIAH